MHSDFAHPEVSIIPAHRTLSGFASARECEEGVAIDSLDPGTTLVVTTRNSKYRLVVFDGASQEVLVQGGTTFPKAVRAVLQGSCDGSLVKAGWIGSRMRMVLFAESGWVRTSQVLSVAIESSGLSPDER